MRATTRVKGAGEVTFTARFSEDANAALSGQGTLDFEHESISLVLGNITYSQGDAGARFSGVVNINGGAGAASNATGSGDLTVSVQQQSRAEVTFNASLIANWVFQNPISITASPDEPLPQTRSPRLSREYGPPFVL